MGSDGGIVLNKMLMLNKKVLVFDIKEFSVNDGPGSRITVFLKGCPMRCLWCHNPEGLSYENQLNLITKRMYAREYTTKELLGYLLKFKDFFSISNGGVTFSGGECTSHFEFMMEILKLLNTHQIHSAIQTSGHCETSKFMQIAQIADLILYDLKLINTENHIKYTNVDNALILKNLALLMKNNKNVIIRIPIIPTITDTSENLKDIFDFIISLKSKPIAIEFLNYNALAPAKYKNIGMTYKLSNIPNKGNTSLIEQYIDKLKVHKYVCMFRR